VSRQSERTRRRKRWINGYVVEQAGVAVEVPVNETLTALVRAWEADGR